MGSKLPLIIVGGILVSGVAVGAFFFLRSRPSTQSVELAPVTAQASPTLAPEPEQVTYQNDAGFSFTHPNNLTIKENVLDAVSYADLEITDDTRVGKITIKIVDTKLKDSAAWTKANKVPATAVTTDVMLGDVKAKRIDDSSNLKLVAVGQSVLYTIEVLEADEYWTEVFDTIVSTWKFELPQESPAVPAQKSGSNPASGDIYEEETIE